MTTLKKDDDEDTLDNEFLRYLSSNIPPPIRPPPPPNQSSATTTIPTEKAIEIMDVDTPPTVVTDYYDANDDTCPRLNAPSLV
jgi:hypothetical protein